MGFKKHFIHAIVILAILSATISPACAFISGQNATWVEICSGMSSKLVKTDGTREAAPDITSDSCPFCFHNTSVNGLENNTQAIIALKQPPLHNSFINEVALLRAVKTTHARAPPSFI